jgi:nucleoside permease NupC
MDWVRKFIINRLLFLVLLMALCLGIFPFMVLYPLTMRIGMVLGKLLGNSELPSKVDAAWDVFGNPYDALVKMVA